MIVRREAGQVIEAHILRPDRYKHARQGDPEKIFANGIGIAAKKDDAFRLNVSADPDSCLNLIVRFPDEMDIDVLIIPPQPYLYLFQDGLEEQVLIAPDDDGNLRRRHLFQLPGVGVWLVIALAYDLIDFFSCFFTDIRPVIDHSRNGANTVAGYPSNIFDRSHNAAFTILAVRLPRQGMLRPSRRRRRRFDVGFDTGLLSVPFVSVTVAVNVSI